MAPDKIYIPENISKSDLLCMLSSDSKGRGIEYIRKDALMEWAKKKNKRIDTEDGDYSLGYVSAMIDLIEKIESL